MANKETKVGDLKNIWNKFNDCPDLDELLKNLRENEGKEIKDWLYLATHLPFINKELSYLKKDAKIMEAGCGIGQWVFWIAEQGFPVIGVDIAPKAVAVAKDYAKKNKIINCDFVEGDIRNLKIEDNHFDFIFSFGVIEHFHKPEIILNEFKRVLKVGGKMFISVPNQYSTHTFTRVISKVIGRWDLGYERSYSQKSLNKLFEKADLKVLRSGIMPGTELFGRGITIVPKIGNSIFKVLSKISLYIESRQNIFGFWIYSVAEKK